jgi:hypothetical protein
MKNRRKGGWGGGDWIALPDNMVGLKWNT